MDKMTKGVLIAAVFLVTALSCNVITTTHVYEVVELTFNANKTHANPYIDVDLWVNLNGPGGTYRIPAFWDGGNNFRAYGDIGLLRTHRGILAKATLATETALTCSRCLTLFHCPLSLNIEEEYVPVLDIITGAPLPPPEDPGSFAIDGHHILDLTEAIRQYALLATPMKPLCREDCTGLCPICGRNPNAGSCACAS